VIFEFATPGDAPDLADLHAAAFSHPWSANEIASMVRAVGGFAFVARQAERIAGFVLCRTIADESEILTLATLPTRRRLGVGRGLVDAAAAHAAARGAVKLFLEVAEDNHAAIALYRGFGFEQVGARAAYYSRRGGAITALVMRRDLNR
jgi:ribosomal-protein-alanine N-acetyltransferase